MSKEGLNSRKAILIFKRSINLNIGILLVFIMILPAIFPQFIATHNPTEVSFEDMLEAPSREHFFGTDNYGRDIFSRGI